MSKLIGTVRIVNGKVQLTRIGEGEKIKIGSAYKMYAALRKVQNGK